MMLHPPLPAAAAMRGVAHDSPSWSEEGGGLFGSGAASPREAAVMCNVCDRGAQDLGCD